MGVVKHVRGDAILSGKMGKNCCAVRCTNRRYRGCGLEFYRFPRDPDRKRLWIAAVSRIPNEFA